LQIEEKVIILFDDERLRKLCEDEKTAKKNLGRDSAKKLKSRLADLRAAQTVRDLVAGKPHPLKRDRAGEFSLELHGGVRLVFAPANEPAPRTVDEAVDWARVTEVLVIYIGDYHD
jgi:proteic killer suppression protein